MMLREQARGIHSLIQTVQYILVWTEYLDLFWVLVLFFLEGDTGSEDPVFEGTSPDEVQPCTGGEGGSEGFGVIEDRFGVATFGRAAAAAL